MIAPASGKRLASLPRNPLSAHRRPLCGLALFRGYKIPAVIRFHKVKSAVNNAMRLKPTRHLQKLHSIPILPCLAELALRGVVEPDDIYASIIGKQFAHLIEHVLAVTVHVAIGVKLGDSYLFVTFDLPEKRMGMVHRIVRMLPVHD